MTAGNVQGSQSPHPSLARRLAAMAYESLIVAAILLAASLAFMGATTSRLEGPARHLFQAYLDEDFQAWLKRSSE